MNSSLKPKDVVAIVDTREQQPWDLTPLQSVFGTLTTGDYTVRGLEHVEDYDLDDDVVEQIILCLYDFKNRRCNCNN